MLFHKKRTIGGNERFFRVVDIPKGCMIFFPPESKLPKAFKSMDIKLAQAKMTTTIPIYL